MTGGSPLRWTHATWSARRSRAVRLGVWAGAAQSRQPPGSSPCSPPPGRSSATTSGRSPSKARSPQWPGATTAEGPRSFDDMLTFAIALKNKGVPVPERNWPSRRGRTRSSPSVASLYRAFAEAEDQDVQGRRAGRRPAPPHPCPAHRPGQRHRPGADGKAHPAGARRDERRGDGFAGRPARRRDAKCSRCCRTARRGRRRPAHQRADRAENADPRVPALHGWARQARQARIIAAEDRLTVTWHRLSCTHYAADSGPVGRSGLSVVADGRRWA